MLEVVLAFTCSSAAVALVATARSPVPATFWLLNLGAEYPSPKKANLSKYSRII